MSSRSVILCIILFTGLFSFQKVFSQRVLGGFSVGMNLTQVEFDAFRGFHKVGLSLGPMVSIPFSPNRNWSVSMELLYTQKGSNHTGSPDSLSYKLKQDYAEVPIMIHFTDKKIVSAGVGFSYGQLINKKEIFNESSEGRDFYFSETQPGYVKLANPMSNFEIAALAEVQIRLWANLWIGARVQRSITSNRSVLFSQSLPANWDDPSNSEISTEKQYNYLINFRLTWIFNQEKAEKNAKKSQAPIDYSN